jgi:hypothetical protein
LLIYTHVLNRGPKAIRSRLDGQAILRMDQKSGRPTRRPLFKYSLKRVYRGPSPAGRNLYPYIRLGPRWGVKGGRMIISMSFKRIIVFT